MTGIGVSFMRGELSLGKSFAMPLHTPGIMHQSFVSLAPLGPGISGT